MTRAFVYAKKFNDKWNNLKLTDIDLFALEEYLLQNPDAGDVIVGSGGVRKLRWALPNTGKSGGMRILYLDIVIIEQIYMIDLFAKSKKSNLNNAEKKELKQLTDRIYKGEE